MITPMTDDEIAAAQRLCEDATPGRHLRLSAGERRPAASTDFDARLAVVEDAARAARPVIHSPWYTRKEEDEYAEDEQGYVIHGEHEEDQVALVADLSEYHVSASRLIAEHIAAASPTVVLEMVAAIRSQSSALEAATARIHGLEASVDSMRPVVVAAEELHDFAISCGQPSVYGQAVKSAIGAQIEAYRASRSTAT